MARNSSRSVVAGHRRSVSTIVRTNTALLRSSSASSSNRETSMSPYSYLAATRIVASLGAIESNAQFFSANATALARSAGVILR